MQKGSAKQIYGAGRGGGAGAWREGRGESWGPGGGEVSTCIEALGATGGTASMRPFETPQAPGGRAWGVFARTPRPEGRMGLLWN